MKTNTLKTAMLILAGVAFVASSVKAQTPVSYTPDDLFLGFRASGGTGATQDYLVNIGPASGLTTGTLSLGNMGADLTSLFGATWNTRSDLFWSISGTPGLSAANGDVANTLYATKQEAVVGVQESAWVRKSNSTQSQPAAKINAMAAVYVTPFGTSTTNNSTANSSKAIIQNYSDTNSYGSYQPGGPNAGLSPGNSYAYFNPTIEGNFLNGTSGSALDLFKMTPSTTAGLTGDYLGKFTLNNSGNLNFTAAAVPEPSTSTSFAVGAGLLLVVVAFRRRRMRVSPR